MTATCAILVLQKAKFHVAVIFSSEVTTNYKKYDDDVYHCFKGDVEQSYDLHTHNIQIRFKSIEIKESVNTNLEF